jgi:hypothetical protein
MFASLQYTALRQRKNPERLSVYDYASWIFSLPCISPFLNGLRILKHSTASEHTLRRNRLFGRNKKG